MLNQDNQLNKHADELKAGKLVLNEDGLFVKPKIGKVLNAKNEKEKVSFDKKSEEVTDSKYCI